MTSRARAYTAKQRTAALALVRAGSLITAASRATGVSRWTLLAPRRGRTRNVKPPRPTLFTFYFLRKN